MLAPAKLEAVHQLIADCNTAELLWISGYLSGLATNPAAAKAALPQQQDASQPKTVTILYATETGNSKKVATQTTAKLKQQGIKTKLVAVENYKPEHLLTETHLVIAISTQGEGEPPVTAKAFYDYLHQMQDSLSHLNYSVLALGSKSYPLFCQAGLDVDAQFKRLKATPFVPIHLCDDDYEPVAEAWTVALLDVLLQTAAPAPTIKTVAAKADSKKTYKATIGNNLLLNDRGSNKKVHHLELDLPEEVLYNPGNAIGIVPENNSEVVSKILELLRLQPNDKVSFKGETYEAFELLQKKTSISYLTLGVIKKYAQLLQLEIPETRMDLYDLLRIYPLDKENEAQAVIDLLNPITPRLYTIASAPNAHPGQLHITVALHQFETEVGATDGFGSGYVTNLAPGKQLEFFLHQQKNFQVPRSDRHLIMIGQSTGIAPFRSMIAERDATGASGKNWLIFGEADFVTDFYYQTEIQSWFETGSLQHINLAFEKNRMESLKVQDVLLKESERVWQWIESGAYIMVSGEKEPMGKAVEAALTTIIADKKQISQNEAADLLKQLSKEGRFAKELY